MIKQQGEDDSVTIRAAIRQTIGIENFNWQIRFEHVYLTFKAAIE